MERVAWVRRLSALIFAEACSHVSVYHRRVRPIGRTTPQPVPTQGRTGKRRPQKLVARDERFWLDVGIGGR